MGVHKRTARTCQMCGAEFIGGGSSLFCGDCKPKRQREYIREYQRRQSEIKKELHQNTYTCEDCGVVLPIPNGHKPKRCPDCAKERNRETRRRWQAEHEGKSFKPVRIMRGKKPAQSFEDIRAIQRRRETETGRYYTYGQIASEPLLAQQAAEMAERRKQLGL